jgi:ligand-binding sensor domain-containing protein
VSLRSRFRWITISCAIVVVAIYSETTAPGDTPKSNSASLTYHHRAWKKGQGLPDDTVNAITQTKDGYLWIGTRGGLVRFDGVKFSVFDRSNTPQITSDEIHCLRADDDGGLWIGTARGLWHRSAEGFDWSQPGEQDCSRVQDLALSSHGLWVLTACGLHQFTAGKLGPPIPATAPATRINAIQEDPMGGLWLGMEHGLRRLDPATGKLSEPLVPPDLARRVPQVIVQRIEQGPDGTLWADFRGFRLADDYLNSRTWVYGLRDGEWIECSTNPFCNDERPFFIGHDRAGALWLPNGERGVVRYHNGKASSLPFDEMADYATCFFADHEGNIWVGTETKGLHRFRPKHGGA